MLCIISTGHSSKQCLANLCTWCAIDEFDMLTDTVDHTLLYATQVILNGMWVGITQNGPALIATLTRLRRKHKLHFETCFYLSKNNSVIIRTDEGRYLRPCLISEYLGEVKTLLENKRSHVNVWELCLNRGYLEYFSPPMIDNHPLKTIASTYEEFYAHPEIFTHVEVVPSVIFGLSAGQVRFAQHNPRYFRLVCLFLSALTFSFSPRNIFQTAIAKQAIQPYGYAISEMRSETMTLCYAQRSKIRTTCSNLPLFREFSHSTEAIVAICTMGGYMLCYMLCSYTHLLFL